MNNVRTRVRWIITGSLLLSLSMMSLYPRLMSSGGRKVVAATKQAPKACCCGTENGRCCGTACCQVPNQKHENTPASPKPSEDRAQPLGLVPTPDALLDSSSTAALRRDMGRNAAIAISSSLIAMSIRLNI